jgi:flagellar basal body-associated protein FliL
MKSSQKQRIVTALGSLLAVLMICVQLFVSQAGKVADNTSESETEQSAPSERSQEAMILASYSLPAPIHVPLNFDAHVLFEILYQNEDEQDAPEVEVLSHPSKLLVTLFQVIISPNAP